LPAFGVLLIAGVWAAMWLEMRATESALIVAVTHDTENLAAEYEQYTRRAVKDADQTTLIIKHEFEHHHSLDLSGLLRRGLIESTETELISVADANGNIIVRSRAANPVNIADRDYFRRHAGRDTGLLDISKPVISRSTGRTQILLSRRLNTADGAFAGIVMVSVTPEYFTEFYQGSELGSRGSLGVVGRDAGFRARRVGDYVITDIGESAPHLVARVEAKPIGHYEERDEFDNVMRIVAYHALTDYPLVVITAQARDEALAGFYKNRSRYLLVATAITGVLLVFFATITVQAIRLERRRAELKVQRRLLEMLLDNVPSGITVRSMRPGSAGEYVLWNESNTLIYGIKPGDALGKRVEDIMQPDNAAEILDLDRKLLASPMIQEIEQASDVPGGGTRLYHLIRAPIFGASGEVEHIMTSASDITDERARNDELALAAKVFETTADAIVLSDGDDRVVKVNAAFAKLTGYDASEIVGRVLAESPFRPIDSVESKARLELQHRDGFVTGEVPRFRKDGTPLALWVTASMVRNGDGSIRNYVRVFTDISLLKETEWKLEQLASFDTLTGLPSRRLLLDRLEQAVHRAQRSNHGLAVMFVDLDGFKAVNDTYGHDVGDKLLRETAERLQRCIRLSDSIGRLGGDEFAIVLEDARIPADAACVGERIIEALALPLVVDGENLTIAASVGIAIYPNDGTDSATLLKHADVAMYSAKQAGRNRYRFYSSCTDAETVAPGG
jgi:diguanylate cyclase (GGDEF)-like protein/PAS domain S-box-containing protein